MSPNEVLEQTYYQVMNGPHHPIISDPDILQYIHIIAYSSVGAPLRVVLACSLAKIMDNTRDIRKPYTEIGDADTFSGRTYDETYIAPFINRYQLPANSTTGFLTPAFRNRNTTLTRDSELVGRPKETYDAMLQLLNDIQEQKATALELLHDVILTLVQIRDERRARMESQLAELSASRHGVVLSSEQIVDLIAQHLSAKRSTRLPVLVVAAAYITAQPFLHEFLLPLEAHNAADSQTKSLGDVQVVLAGSDSVVTCYELKARVITTLDVDVALGKLALSNQRPDNYIFITTEPILPEVVVYANAKYEEIGIEISVLDCIDFLRHFLHLFHRHRLTFLDSYQEILLSEPNSAVGQPLKELFLTLRRVKESGE